MNWETQPGSILWDLFASEVSFTANPNDHDRDVMTTWIAQLHDMGVNVASDPGIPEIRREVLQNLWDWDEARRVDAYAAIQTMPSDQLELAMQDYQGLIDHQQIITNLLAGNCIWWGN